MWRGNLPKLWRRVIEERGDLARFFDREIVAVLEKVDTPSIESIDSASNDEDSNHPALNTDDDAPSLDHSPLLREMNLDPKKDYSVSEAVSTLTGELKSPLYQSAINTRVGEGIVKKITGNGRKSYLIAGGDVPILWGRLIEKRKDLAGKFNTKIVEFFSRSNGGDTRAPPAPNLETSGEQSPLQPEVANAGSGDHAEDQTDEDEGGD